MKSPCKVGWVVWALMIFKYFKEFGLIAFNLDGVLWGCVLKVNSVIFKILKVKNSKKNINLLCNILN